MATDVLRDAWGDLLWETWGSFGVSSWSRDGARTVVDPEALIVLTIQHGDLRLTHETIDWAILHAHLLLPSRIRTLARETEMMPAAADWLELVAEHTRTARWTRTSAASSPGFSPSGRSMRLEEMPLTSPAALTLRARGVHGASIRGEAIRAFHESAFHGGHSELDIIDIAHRAATTPRQARTVVEDLVSAGVVAVSGSPRRRRYAPRSDTALARAAWLPWLETPPGPWRAAVTAMPLLASLLDAQSIGARDPLTIAARLQRYEEARPALRKLLGIEPSAIERSGAAHVGAALTKTALDLIAVAAERLRGK